MAALEQLPQHVVVGCLARAGAKEQHRIARLDWIERVVTGDLLDDVEPVALLEHEQPRRQSRCLVLIGRFANENDVELQPVGLTARQQLSSVIQDRIADGIGPPHQLELVAGLERLGLATGTTRLPVTQAERRVLTRMVRRQGKIRANAHRQEIGVGVMHPHDRRVVALLPQLGDLFRSHGCLPSRTRKSSPATPPCPALRSGQ